MKIEGLNIPVKTMVDSETYDYLLQVSGSKNVSLETLIKSILVTEKDKAKVRPKIVVEKE